MLKHDLRFAQARNKKIAQQTHRRHKKEIGLAFLQVFFVSGQVRLMTICRGFYIKIPSILTSIKALF